MANCKVSIVITEDAYAMRPRDEKTALYEPVPQGCLIALDILQNSVIVALEL